MISRPYRIHSSHKLMILMMSGDRLRAPALCLGQRVAMSAAIKMEDQSYLPLLYQLHLAPALQSSAQIPKITWRVSLWIPALLLILVTRGL